MLKRWFRTFFDVDDVVNTPSRWLEWWRHNVAMLRCCDDSAHFWCRWRPNNKSLFKLVRTTIFLIQAWWGRHQGSKTVSTGQIGPQEPSGLIYKDFHYFFRQTCLLFLRLVTFDCKLNWQMYTSKAISKAKKSHYSLRLLWRFFNNNEMRNLLDSHFYSSLYYNAVIWLTPSLNADMKHKYHPLPFFS